MALISPWLLISLTTALFFVFKYLKTYLRCVWLVFRLPGPPALPLIGHAHWAISPQLAQDAVETSKKYGLLIGVWLSIFPVPVVYDPHHLQKILTNSKHVEKMRLYKMVQDLIGPGLISLDSQIWKIHRRLMQPNFNLKHLKPFVDIFNKAADIFVGELQNQLDTGCRDIKISPITNELIFSLLRESVFGIKMELTSTKMADSPYCKCSFSMIHRMLRPWLLIPALFQMTEMAKTEVDHKNMVLSFTKKTMEERKKLYKDGVITEPACLLDMLLKISSENPETFTEDDCVVEATTLMLAGQESVAGSLAFTLHCLANNPIAQEKAANEQRDIFGDTEIPATLEDLSKMTYLNLCIKEALRLYPTVPIFGRKLGEDVQLGKWLVPKGCEIIMTPFVTHRLEEYFPEPESFKPERFEPEAEAKLHPYCYIPFSAGPRNCIGYKYAELEMKSILSAVLRKFQLHPVEGRENITISYKVSLRAKGGIWVGITPRNNQK